MAQRYEANTPSVIFEDFGDETILIHLDTGFYYSLDATGMTLWGLFSRGFTLDEACTRLDAVYEQEGTTLRDAASSFLDRLHEEGLLRESPATEAPEQSAPVESGPRTRFVAPRLSRFEDMEQMFLLDPVHDVTEQGWPMAAPEDQKAE